MSIRTKLTIFLVLLISGTVLVLGIFTARQLEDYFRTRMAGDLSTYADQIDFVIRTQATSDSNRYETLQKFVHISSHRLTLIDSNGTVIFESDLPPDKLNGVDNHMNRPEVQEALRNGTGATIRHSATINTDMLYYARKVSLPLPPETDFARTTILRVAVPYTQFDQLQKEIRSTVLLTGIGVLALLIVTSILIARRISLPLKNMARIAAQIRSGNLDKRISYKSNDELGKLADTLNDMIDKLNQDIATMTKLERVRSEFLGNVSHELRTPIFAIQGMLETLLQGALEDKEVNRDFVERALRNTKNLNNLLGDLIEISRIESGEMKMSFRYFTVNEFLEQIVTEMQPLAKQKGIALMVHPDSSKPDALGDKERLKQVMVNLIDNAIKYTNSGGNVVVSYRTIEQGVKISVQDTGVGIAEEHLPRIFERFYRVDKERSREAGGTGLGLAIVKHIVEAHGSKVEVQSEVAKGSTFSFMLKK